MENIITITNTETGESITLDLDEYWIDVDGKVHKKGE